MKTNPENSFSTTGKVGKSLLLLLPMTLLIFILSTGGQPNFSSQVSLIAFLITFFFFNFLFFMILYKGKVDKYRAAGFILLALFFALTFIVNLIGMRGTMTFNNETALACEIPFCHIVTTMVILPVIISGSIIFPGSIIGGFASITSMLVIVIGVMIALGRGFCSWGCFYGGWDDGTSRILRKPVIKKVNPAFRWASFAVLIIVAIMSLLLVGPFYCDWLCPFKTVTEFEKVTSFTVLLKTISFISLFAALVIILPLLTKKRIQCTTFCPMGALCSLSNKINVFDVSIDKEKCNDCMLCTKVCPTMSLEKQDVEKGKPSITCMKCGKCIDSCKRGAINYHIKGTPVGKRVTLARMLFLYPAFILLVVFTSGTMQQGIVLLVKLFTTGSLLK
jgi:ferredoxin-type protein NapH